MRSCLIAITRRLAWSCHWNILTGAAKHAMDQLELVIVLVPAILVGRADLTLPVLRAWRQSLVKHQSLMSTTEQM
jgi:hypothetical protein